MPEIKQPTAAELAEKAGIGQADVMAEQAKFSNINPDVLIGNIAGRSAVSSAKPARQQMDTGMQKAQDIMTEIAGQSGIEQPQMQKQPAQRFKPESQQVQPVQPQMPDVFSMQQQSIERQRQLLEADLKDKENRIRQQVEEATRQAQETGKQIMGSSRSQLARMGALGTTSAGLSYLNDIQIKNDQRIADIQSQGQQLIADAQRAKTAGDLELLDKSLEAMQSLKDDYYRQQEEHRSNVEFSLKLQEYQRESASQTLDVMAASGVEVPDAYLSQLDRQMGYPSGVSKGILDTAKAEREAAAMASEQERRAFEMEQASKLVGVLDKIPQGQTINIGDTEYTGIKQGNYKSYLETDENGNAKGVTFDPVTGDYSVVDLGYQGGTEKDGWKLTFDGQGNPWKFNENTGQMLYAGNPSSGGNGVSGTSWNELMPNGTDFNWYDEQDGDYFSGECGEFVRWATNGAIRVGDDLDSKMAITDPSITPDNVRVGDVFVQDVGPNAHIGIVSAVIRQDDGRIALKLTESNRNLDGKITNDVQVYADDPTIKGFGRYNLRPELMKGSDTPVFEKKGIERVAIEQASPEMQDAITSLAINLPKAQMERLESGISEALASGNTDRVKELIKNGVRTSLSTGAQEMYDGRIKSIDALNNVKETIQEYEAAGGKLGLLKGNAESIANKLGQITDPALVDIATRMQLALIDYRRAVSGAAFTESEMQQYNQLFPTTKGKAELSLQKIDTLTDIFHRNNQSSVSAVIGQDSYDALFKEPEDMAGQTSGETPQFVEAEGMRWQLQPDGTYEAIMTLQ